MTKCFACGKDLKKWDALRGIVDWHPEGFCLKCLIQWNKEEKQRSISMLFEGGTPVPLFMIPDTQTSDPTEKDNKNLAPIQKGNIFRGPIVFTDKGIYFVTLYEFREKALPPDPEFEIIFGRLIGRRLDEKLQKTKEKHQADIQTRWKRAEEEAQAAEDLTALLQKGHNVLSYRKESIVGITYDPKKGIEIKATGRAPAQVFFKVAEDVYRQFEPMVKMYIASK